MQFTDSACKVIKRVADYLVQQHLKLFELFFSKLPMGNGAPHASSVKLGRSCMQFATRAQITFGAIFLQKKICHLLECVDKSKQTTFQCCGLASF
jgi:hypothetical protein